MVDVSPRAPTAHRGLAEVYTRAEKYPEAARECRVAIQLDPGFTDAYELLGVVSAKQGDNATARQAFEAALRLAPNRASISANLGVLAVNEGKLDAALTYFRQAAKLNPESADIHYKLGSTLAMTGDNEGARSEAALLDRLDPGLARDLRQVIQEGTGQPQAP
jgi:Flp pilus assembly protein TadD